MGPNLERLFWERFSSQFQLDRFMFLKGMTQSWKTSKIEANHFPKDSEKSAQLYAYVARQLLEAAGLADDVELYYSTQDQVHKVDSIQLIHHLDHLSTTTRQAQLDTLNSLDALQQHLSDYTIDLSPYFSYLLGSYCLNGHSLYIRSNDHQKLYRLHLLAYPFCFGSDAVSLTLSKAVDRSHLTIQSPRLLQELHKAQARLVARVG